jgi:hypothetical protein
LLDRGAADWWTQLAEMEEDQFLREVDRLLNPEDGNLAAVRSLLSQ